MVFMFTRIPTSKVAADLPKQLQVPSTGRTEETKINIQQVASLISEHLDLSRVREHPLETFSKVYDE